MQQLVLNIKNDNIMDKLLWMLEHFKSDGVEIQQEQKTRNQQGETDFSDEYIKNNWREIGMSTNSAHFDDDDMLEEAYWEHHNKKLSS
ncbi:MAG: hypothetical protein U9R47_10745 [Actinomycetota bacterium]|nr:hypothetical protein [Actinomycetota bacterium]